MLWISLLLISMLVLMSCSTSTLSSSSSSSARRILVVVEAAETPISTTSAGVQTNFGDISFAGGMSYDPQRQIVYVTGQVGPNSCFVGVLKRVEAATTVSYEDDNNNNQQQLHPTHLEFISKQVFDETAICQTITFRKDTSRPGDALLLSIAEEGGLLTDHRVEGSRKVTQYGGIVALNFNSDGKSSEYNPDQSVLLHQSAAVTIPRSITSDPKRTNRVFIATMTSESTQVEYRNALGHKNNGNGEGEGEGEGEATPNLTPAGGLLKYGNGFAMTVESIRLATEFSTAEPQWRKPFGIKHETNNSGDATSSSTRSRASGVTVNQILCRQPQQQQQQQQNQNENDDNEESHVLYIVGSTLGSGPAFGELVLDNDTGHGVVAGFITRLNSDTGELVSSRRFLGGNKNELSLPLEDTYIEAICEATDNEDAIYIVGSYSRTVNGDSIRRRRRRRQQQQQQSLAEDVDTQTPVPTFDDTDNNNDDDDYDDEVGQNQFIDTPFTAKLKASTLETVWQKTFESTTNARLLGCGVDPESNGMYVAGLVENGGHLVGRTTSYLGDDIFLIRLRTSDGAVPWAKQLGTSGNDRLAYGGSGLVVLNGEKGVLLMGDTTSDLYSVSEQDKEIFVVEVDAHGNFPQITETTGVDYSASSSLVKLSSPIKVDGTEEVTEGGSNSNNNNNDSVDLTTPSDKPLISDTITEDSTDIINSIATADSDSNTNTSVQRDRGHEFFLLVSLGLLAVVASSGLYLILSKKKEKEATERALVFSYLQNFDLEDIDVKQAATGGWHGTYIRSLANGVNVLDGDGEVLVSDDIDEVTQRRLNNLSHSSVVKDILFMDYEDSASSNGNSNKKDHQNLVRDPITYNNNDENEDNRNISPWGNEIL